LLEEVLPTAKRLLPKKLGTVAEEGGGILHDNYWMVY